MYTAWELHFMTELLIACDDNSVNLIVYDVSTIIVLWAN